LKTVLKGCGTLLRNAKANKSMEKWIYNITQSLKVASTR
jgi:hypothetical protein